MQATEKDRELAERVVQEYHSYAPAHFEAGKNRPDIREKVDIARLAISIERSETLKRIDDMLVDRGLYRMLLNAETRTQLQELRASITKVERP